MPPLTTGSEVRSTPPDAAGGPSVSAAPARARARITATDGDGNQFRGRIQRAFAGWWGFTARPATLAETWQVSAVDPRRIPGKSGLLRGLWVLSNHTDRLLLFALLFAAPTGLQGPLRWLIQRPTRRWGFYLVCAALGGAIWITGKG